jgi:hypothetical protein
MEKALIEKYKIHFINGKRYYEFDMTNLLPSLEHTVPYFFKYNDIEIYSSAWNKLTLDILSAIDEKNPKSDEELLSIRYPWTKTDIFSSVKRTNYSQFKSLYLNTNHTSSHAMLNIQGLLKAYNIPLEKCYCLIKRHFVAEPLEVIEDIRTESISLFSLFLQLKGYTNEKISMIISKFEKINKILAKVSPGYNDFFLFDDHNTFFNYKIHVLEWLEKRQYSEQDKTYRVIKKCLELIDGFYKAKRITGLFDKYVTVTNEP